MLDTIVEHGSVVDGTGRPAVKADVGMRAGRITAVGDLSATPAQTRIDAAGRVVCPGFIDPHTHCGPGPNLNYLHQGVTLVVGGNCGSSKIDLSEIANRFNEPRSAVNLATLVGHNSIRDAVMGNVDRPATAEEKEKMRELVRTAMEAGALGFSTGLIYVPGTYADTEEVIDLARVATRYGGYYATHMRSESNDVAEALGEALRVGREAGTRVQISHHKVSGKGNWGRSTETLAALDAARAGGIDVAQDQYPYTASQTTLHVLLPDWAREGTEQDLRERLDHNETRSTIRDAIERKIEDYYAGDLSRLVIATCAGDRGVEGMDLTAIAAAAGREPTARGGADTAVELIRRHSDPARISAIYHTMHEDDVVRILRHPFTAVGSDGWSVSQGQGKPHPRSYGTFPRVLGRYCREMGLFGLEEAVRKMTSLTASRLGLGDRGIIREGAVADVVVLDPERVVDKATFMEPHQYAEGIDYVFVNGAMAADHGEHTGELPGRFVRR